MGMTRPVSVVCQSCSSLLRVVIGSLVKHTATKQRRPHEARLFLLPQMAKGNRAGLDRSHRARVTQVTIMVPPILLVSSKVNDTRVV